MPQRARQELVDTAALERFLRAELPQAQGALDVQRHEAGYSNETFFVTCGNERWVLRRPPRGELLPTSHDVLREWRVISALHKVGVRVPRPTAACEDPSVIGAPFYVMERIDGFVIRDCVPPALDNPEQRRRMTEELITTLAEIHAVDWRSAGLESFGKPEGYVERQLRRWSGQLELTRERTRPLPGIDEVTNWLQDHLPKSRPATVVHGDYTLYNVMFAWDAPARLLAVFDWEMATLGDPLADLGYTLAHWGPGGADERDLPELHGLTQQEGFPSRADVVALYEQKTGRAVVDFPFYLCLALWKVAIICEGLYALYLEGRAPNVRTMEMERRVPALIRRTHQVIEEA